MKLELVVSNTRADEVIKSITSAARSGMIGDGKIFVLDFTDAVRIRNDDRGDAAL